MPEKARIDYGGRNVPVNDVARIMGKSPQFIRVGLQRGILPFGVAMKTNEGNEQYDYYISPKLFAEYTGCKMDAADDIEEEYERKEDEYEFD